MTAVARLCRRLSASGKYHPTRSPSRRSTRSAWAAGDGRGARGRVGGGGGDGGLIAGGDGARAGRGERVRRPPTEVPARRGGARLASRRRAAGDAPWGGDLCSITDSMMEPDLSKLGGS